MADRNPNDLSAVPSPAEIHDWPELLAKTMDDAAKLFGAQLHLFEANLKGTMEAQIQRLMGTLIAVFALAYGALFVLGAIATLLHRALPWWLALGITGLMVIAIGLTVQIALSAVADRKTKSA